MKQNIVSSQFTRSMPASRLHWTAKTTIFLTVCWFLGWLNIVLFFILVGDAIESSSLLVDLLVWMFRLLLFLPLPLLICGGIARILALKPLWIRGGEWGNLGLLVGGTMIVLELLWVIFQLLPF